MRNSVLSRYSPIFFLSTLSLFLVSCGSPGNDQNTLPPKTPPLASPSPVAQNSPTNQTSSSSTRFSIDNVCSIPQQISGNSPFAGLGGGTWKKWGESAGDLEYGCDGGNESVKLEQATARISARYGAFGDAQAVHYVYAKYMALQYGGVTPVEKPLRQQYFDFCDGLSERLYGKKLPEKFKKRLADESTYSTRDKPSEYQEKVTDGYISLGARKEKEGMTTLEVRFFTSEEEFKKYKGS
jgi:hypothetical protein